MEGRQGKMLMHQIRTLVKEGGNMFGVGPPFVGAAALTICSPLPGAGGHAATQ
jgi:hypothetical protein